jgi:hypothetical protein
MRKENNTYGKDKKHQDFTVEFIIKNAGYDLLIAAEHIKYFKYNEKWRIVKKSDIRDFNHKEIAKLKYIIKELVDLYKAKINLHNISFLKLCKGHEWDFPYTFVHKDKNIIVLTETFLANNLILDTTKIYKTIYHEIIHLEQKNNSKKYNDMYKKYLNFDYVKIENLDLIRNNILTNPDGFYNSDYVWIFGGNILPFLSINLDNKLVYVYQNNNKWFIDINQGIKDIMYEPKLYYNFKLRNGQFLHNQLYHPNEIYANLKSDYIISKNHISFY